MVAAIGNKPEQLLPRLSAIYDGVVAVGGTDQTGAIGSVSVTGPQMVLSAPGMRIVSADKSGYAIGDGTSASTAIVAGAAALVRSKYPKLSAPEVIHRLTATATDKGPPGRDAQYGYGVLNLVAALTATVPPISSAPTGPPPTTPSARAAPPARGGTGSALPIVITVTLAVIAAGALAIWLRRRRSAA